MITLSHTPRRAQLLTAGLASGPLFLAVVAGQVATREGYDLGRHPISLLALGGPGWIQIANFVLTGALVVAGAVGLRRALVTGRGRVWGPRLVGAFGLGLITAGVFVTDAGAGFPLGAPAGAPVLSWHGLLHEVGFGIAQLAWIGAAAVFLCRFAGLRRWRATAICTAALITAVALGGWPDPAGFSVRILLASAVELGLVGYLAAQLRWR